MPALVHPNIPRMVGCVSRHHRARLHLPCMAAGATLLARLGAAVKLRTAISSVCYQVCPSVCPGAYLSQQVCVSGHALICCCVLRPECCEEAPDHGLHVAPPVMRAPDALVALRVNTVRLHDWDLKHRSAGGLTQPRLNRVKRSDIWAAVATVQLRYCKLYVACAW